MIVFQVMCVCKVETLCLPLETQWGAGTGALWFVMNEMNLIYLFIYLFLPELMEILKLQRISIDLHKNRGCFFQELHQLLSSGCHLQVGRY